MDPKEKTLELQSTNVSNVRRVSVPGDSPRQRIFTDFVKHSSETKSVCKTCITNVGVASSLDPLFCDFFKSDDLSLVCSAVKHLRNEVMLVPAGCELMFDILNLLQCTVHMLLL